VPGGSLFRRGGRGRWFEGSTQASASGGWSLNIGRPFAGPNVAATATDAGGNTSQFGVKLSPPGPATLISPKGVISDTTPTYTWFEVETSTWYRLWVDGPSGTVINQWYRAEDSNCAGGVCAVTPTRC